MLVIVATALSLSVMAPAPRAQPTWTAMRVGYIHIYPHVRGEIPEIYINEWGYARVHDYKVCKETPYYDVNLGKDAYVEFANRLREMEFHRLPPDTSFHYEERNGSNVLFFEECPHCRIYTVAFNEPGFVRSLLHVVRLYPGGEVVPKAWIEIEAIAKAVHEKTDSRDCPNNRSGSKNTFSSTNEAGS